jgi:type I restriction enzyme S subunit
MREARLGDVVVAMKNGMYKPASEYADDGMPCLRMYNIDAGAIVWRDIKRMKVSPKEYEDYGLHEGDLLVNRVNSRELVGKAAVIPAAQEPSVFESKNIRVRLDTSKALPKFINYQLFARGSKHFANNAQQVVGMASISQGQLADFPIVLTDVNEQRRIVAEIEKQFSRLDEAVANLQRVKANLKRYKAAVLKAAVEGRLVETEASLAHREGQSYETGEQLLQRILSERRTKWAGRGKYKQPTPFDGDGMLSLPNGWTWATVDQLTYLVTSGSRGWGDFYADEGVLFIRAQDIKTDALNIGNAARVNIVVDAEGTRSSVSEDDILVTITGANVTKSALVPPLGEVAFVSQHVALLKLCLPATAKFVFSWIVSSDNGRKTLEKWAYGAGKPGLNLEQVRSLPVALPPLAEQVRIVTELDRHLSILREFEAQVGANLRRAQSLRQSILTKVFSKGATA